MNNKILIRNFGPIKDAEINLNNNFQILIGSQASGKSTLCKIVYFCQKIRDYTLEFFIVIEEPEAHLFPIAQKDMISLIALMVNATDSRVIITTHSPYILTSSNILLYSEKAENNYRGEEKPVIPRSIRLSYHKFAAFKVENTADSLTSLMDENSHMISTDYIDTVSEITNNELEHLFDMEINDDM